MSNMRFVTLVYSDHKNFENDLNHQLSELQTNDGEIVDIKLTIHGDTFVGMIIHE